MTTFKGVDRVAQGNRLLGRRAVIARLGISEATLDRMKRSGGFPQPLRLPTGKQVYLEAEVDAFIQSLLDARAREASPIQRF
jgi:predicted DNA-binding transcriptional regulator AlpA